MSYNVDELNIIIDGVYAETGILLQGWVQDDTYDDDVSVGIEPETGRNMWRQTVAGSTRFFCTGFLQELDGGVVLKHKLKKPVEVCAKDVDSDKVEWYIKPETLVNQVLMNKEVH